MEKATKLFDCIEIQAKHPIPDLLNGKLNGAWVSYSTTQVHEKIYQLAKALIDMGVSAGDGTTEGRDKIGLISENRPEWLITDLAVQLSGAILVPLYTRTGPKELEQILIEAEVKYIFVSNKELHDKVRAIMPNVLSLKEVYTYEQLAGATHWESLLKPVKKADHEKIKTIGNEISGDSVTSIIYTSGTTGRPKGVMLTHRNILSNVIDSSRVLNLIPMAQKRVFSFLPLNHIFEKMISYYYLFWGFSIYYPESLETIAADLKHIKPYLFTNVPRLLEKLLDKLMEAGRNLTGIDRKVFLWAVKLAERFEITNNSVWYKMQLAVADKLVFYKWRKALGDNVTAIILGSTATPVKIEKIFTAAKMIILEGYGLTETSPVISVNTYAADGRKFGTVGPLIENIEVKIAADGEILCKGPNVMAGYYKNPELTSEVLINGWFHTGDIGILDEGKFLKITDRKKEIFKTSGGKYVAPMPIENKMKESPYIEQMMVVGAGRKFTSALIVPSFANLKLWCATNAVTYSSNEELTRHQAVISFFQDIVDSYNPEFNRVEQVKKIVLLDKEWSVDNGELTPTSKMKRKVILEKYQIEIETIYS